MNRERALQVISDNMDQCAPWEPLNLQLLAILQAWLVENQ